MAAERDAYHAAGRLSRATRDLMQSSGELDRPADSYSVIGNVLDAVQSLEMVVGQLADWHRSAEAGRHFEAGHDDSTIGIMTAVEHLDLAMQQVDALQKTISEAYSGNTIVRWLDEVDPAEPE